ncbi:hypothetical protein GE061_005041, partial [Apolygus lucorum]
MPRTHESSGSSSGSVKRNGSRGTSPALPRSRGSEDSFTDLGSTGSEPPTPPEDNINVVVRVRPINKRENSLKDGMTMEFPGNGQIL